MRSEIAKAAPAPVLFVRRGTAAGRARAARDDVDALHLVAAVTSPLRRPLETFRAERVSVARDAADSAPRDSTIAIVGDGFGSLIVYATAVYLGFRPEEITIYGPSDNPVGTYQQFAYNLGPDRPALGVRVALPARRLADVRRSSTRGRAASPSPLLRSIAAQVQPRRAGHPGRGRRRRQRARAGTTARVPGAGRLAAARATGPPPHFVLYDEDANFIGRAKHVMLALGHGPLAFPPVLGEGAARTRRSADRIVQAYEPKQYHPSGRYIVHRRRASPRSTSGRTRSTSAPSASRCAATRRRTSRTSTCRAACSRRSASTPSRASRFDAAHRRSSARSSRAPRRSGAAGRERIERGPRRGPLRGADRRDRPGRARAGRPARPRLEPPRRGPRLARRDRRRRRHRLQQVGAHAAAAAPAGRVLRRAGRATGASSCSRTAASPALDRDDSRLCMMGINANTVIPHGDTIAGLKYIGRRFVADCYEAERAEAAPVPSAASAMQISLARETAQGDPARPRATEQLA